MVYIASFDKELPSNQLQGMEYAPVGFYISIDHAEYMLMRDAEGRKKQARLYKQQLKHNTPKAVTFPQKNELPQACTCTRTRNCTYTDSAFIHTHDNIHYDMF